ncbi:glycosyltransferase family 2 protein [Candidatus Saccharibacteria bacterium]|nr:glycosyltransferase family 2 protein [Candidatus Saccharibacteria bacterium]
MTILQNKKVSVIIPNYNYGKYIKKRIKSILDQTYPIHELIILDDCSTDGSAELIKNLVLDLKLQNPKMNIRFVPNDKNSGKAISQWEKGFELATGDCIWIAEADDLCSKNFLENVMAGFKDKDVVISYAESKVINGKGIMIAPNLRFSRDKERTGHYKNNYVKDGEEEIKEIMAIRCSIPNVSGVVFKKDTKIPFKKYFKEALKFQQVGDWYFYVNILKHGKIAYCKKSLNTFRKHSSSVTKNSNKTGLHLGEIKEMQKYISKNYGLSHEIKQNQEKELARLSSRYGII